MLSEAILAIAEEMEQEVEPVSKLSLKMYAKQLRIAVKASGGMQQQQAFNPLLIDPSTATGQHFNEIEKARAEIRRQRDGAKLVGDHQERVEPRMVQVLDGDLAGTYIPVDPRAPNGCTVIADAITFTLTAEGLKSRD